MSYLYVGLGKSAATDEIWESVEFRDSTEELVELVIDVWLESQGWLCCSIFSFKHALSRILSSRAYSIGNDPESLGLFIK